MTLKQKILVVKFDFDVFRAVWLKPSWTKGKGHTIILYCFRFLEASRKFDLWKFYNLHKRIWQNQDGWCNWRDQSYALVQAPFTGKINPLNQNFCYITFQYFQFSNTLANYKSNGQNVFINRSFHIIHSIYTYLHGYC